MEPTKTAEGIVCKVNADGVTRIYEFGEVFFPNLKCDEKWSQNYGDAIVIGGEFGDVVGSEAFNDERDGVPGVRMTDVFHRTTRDYTNPDNYSDTVEDVMRYTVEQKYAAVEEETFGQIRRRW